MLNIYGADTEFADTKRCLEVTHHPEVLQDCPPASALYIFMQQDLQIPTKVLQFAAICVEAPR